MLLQIRRLDNIYNITFVLSGWYCIVRMEHVICNNDIRGVIVLLEMFHLILKFVI